MTYGPHSMLSINVLMAPLLAGELVVIAARWLRHDKGLPSGALHCRGAAVVYAQLTGLMSTVSDQLAVLHVLLLSRIHEVS